MSRRTIRNILRATVLTLFLATNIMFLLLIQKGHRVDGGGYAMFITMVVVGWVKAEVLMSTMITDEQ